MRTHLIIILGMLLSHVSVSQSVTWYTLEEALELNKEHPKKILIDVYTNWCGWCKQMDAGTFNHPAIAAILNDHFYAVKFNAESKQPVVFSGYTFTNPGEGRSTHMFVLTYASLNGHIGYPTIVYFDENLRRLYVEPGYKTPETIEPVLHYIAKDKYKNISYADYIRSFESALE